METVRQDFVQICTFLGGKHSESTTCSFIFRAFCPWRLHQRWERRVGRAVRSTREQSKCKVQEELNELLGDKMQQELICSAPQGQSQRMTTAGSKWEETVPLPPPARMSRSVVAHFPPDDSRSWRGKRYERVCKKKKLFQGRKQQNYDDKGNNSHMNRIRRD